MKVKRFILDKTALDVLDQHYAFMKKFGMSDMDKEIDRNKEQYDKCEHIRYNMLGIDASTWMFWIDPDGNDNRRFCGRTISLAIGTKFDSDPIYAKEMERGIEFILAQVVAGFHIYGIKNLLWMAADGSNTEITKSNFRCAETEYNDDEWFTIESDISPFLIQKRPFTEGEFKWNNFLKFYESLEKKYVQEGGTGVNIINLGDEKSIEKFKETLDI